MSSDPRTGVAPVTQSPGSRPATYITLLLGAVALVRVGQFFAHLPIRAPFQFDYEEGNILNALLRITQGATPYPDPHAFPNIINPYGPAAYYLLVIPVRLFGPAFVYPRMMILGCALLIAALIAVELRRATGSVALAITFALVFLSIPNIQDWAWLLRVDLLGIAFTTAGLVVFTRYLELGPAEQGRESESKHLLFSALLFAIALVVKPTLIAAPAACFFALIARRRMREGATLTVITAAGFAVVMGIFSVITHGAVLTDVFLSHPDPFALRAYTRGLIQMLEMSWPLVVLGIIGMAGGLARREFSPLPLWLAFATVTAITAGKLGSNPNHFLEWNTALCACAGLGLHQLVRLSARRYFLTATGAAVAVTALVISQQPKPYSNVAPEHGCPAAYAWVRMQAGPNVLSENVGALVLGNKKVWVSNPFVLAQLVEHAGWSDAELVGMVRERRFDAILTRMNYPQVPGYLVHGAERFSPAVLAAIRDNYDAQPGFVCRDMNILYTPQKTTAIQSK